MDEPPKDPSSRELLERIVRLEADNTHLKARYESLSRAFEINAASETKHVCKLYEKIDTLDMLLLELIEKLYPGHARTRLQIINVLKGPQQPETDSKT